MRFSKCCKREIDNKVMYFRPKKFLWITYTHVPIKGDVCPECENVKTAEQIISDYKSIYPDDRTWDIWLPYHKPTPT